MRVKGITVEEERELLRKAKEAKTPLQKKKYMRQIIHHNLNLVKYVVVHYFSFSGLHYEELVAEGTKALVKAVEKFNLDSPNRFAVYCGFWIKQIMCSYIDRTRIVKNSPPGSTSPKIEAVYYDDEIYQTDESSYSLADSLHSDSYENEQKDLRQRDVVKVINKVINFLDNRDIILFTRLYHGIVPNNCWDIYLLLKKEEIQIFFDELKISENKRIDKDLNESLSQIPCISKRKTSTIIDKYLSFFIPVHDYKFSEISKIISKSENYLRKIKKTSLIKLQLLIDDYRKVLPSID